MSYILADQLRGRSYEATPLHIAARFGNPNAIETLLELGADPKAQLTYRLDEGLTPLALATYSACIECAEVLLDKVDYNFYDTANAISLAIQLKQDEMSIFLLKRSGVDVNRYSHHFLQPSYFIEFAILNSKKHSKNNHLTFMPFIIDRPKIVEALIQAGAKSLLNKYSGKIPLHLARNARIARMLLEINEHNIDTKDIDGQTPFSVAFQKDRFEVVEVLIDAGKAN